MNGANWIGLIELFEIAFCPQQLLFQFFCSDAPSMTVAWMNPSRMFAMPESRADHGAGLYFLGATGAWLSPPAR
jgi:hypothetical protein